mmetsp:Transcript_847/g.1495  ORF Transcript_847/g.1495 Transcript_847/m.1495 type:complete len:637 (+) Transcript_847:166-2076(+)|eukprot:CAMPEP_0182459960 /NCGR_PEP_ID=MMETSP1319-20130603/4965_1 /TAXON_ID=172717 /ORGANISM="Bolidomonas pacifica, Strain RCC208" /LENGTH=636 /DNA_ID=CAMNT_0024658983 /DNA_START=76 /DNA_END=1986 /DNA_ORIENTATION=+
MNLKIFNKTNKVVAGNDPLPQVKKEVKRSPPTPIHTLSSGDVDVDAEVTTLLSPSSRRERVRTMGQKVTDAATEERIKRNTDSMLEDAVIANHLKKRLQIRFEQLTKKTLVDNTFSNFILAEITRGSETMSSVKPTDEKKSHASDLAIKAAMEGYFSNMDEDSIKAAKELFMESLEREEFSRDSFLCKQNDEGDKLFVLELGEVHFIVNNQYAGSAKDGAVFGELSLIYGVRRQCDIKAATDCIVWTLNALAFRRIQAITARESLKTSKSKIMTKFGKQASTLAEEQETAKKIEAKIPFEDLKLLSVVGQGTFGAVYITASKSFPDESFALKRMSKASIVDRENERRVIIERNALQAMQANGGCPFIISLMGTYQDKDCVYFLTECVQGGNLISYMIDQDILTHSESMFFIYNIAMALIHCHNAGYIHRDVKPENCLIDKDGYVKLCDFGMAKRLPCTVVLPNGGTEVVRLAFTMCGTPEFMAPEFVLSTGYDRGVDIWALGCIMVEMYTGRGPFDFDGDLKKTFKAVCLIGMGRKSLDLPKQLKKKGMQAAGDYAQKLLVAAKDRIGGNSPEDVIKHPYFEGLPFEEINSKSFQAPFIPKVKNARDASNFKQDGETPKEDPIEPFDGDSAWCENF